MSAPRVENESSRRVALVTGGTRGIGEAIARRLAGDGFAVFISGSSEESTGKALARFAKEKVGIPIRGFAADARREADQKRRAAQKRAASGLEEADAAEARDKRQARAKAAKTASAKKAAATNRAAARTADVEKGKARAVSLADARKKAAESQARSELDEARTTKKSAAATRADADRLSELAETKKQQRKQD